jgi:hypothetical protein
MNGISKTNQETQGNVTSNRLFLNSPKQLKPIRATGDTLAHPAEAIEPTYHQHDGKLKKFFRSGERTSSVLDVEAKIISPTMAQSMDN